MRKIGLIILPFSVAAFALFACAPALGEATPTATGPAPVIGTETPTIVWFPATRTPTVLPTEPPPPTSERRPGIGGVLFRDDFSDTRLWQIAASEQAAAIVESKRLTLSVRAPKSAVFSLRSEPSMDNFYAEVTARTNLCSGSDEYGMIFRASPGNNYYRYVLACDGTTHLEIVRNAQKSPLSEPIFSGDAPPGAPGEVRLGVWASGTELRFFLNGRYQFSVLDRTFSNGTLGFFARSSGENPLSVNFSDLTVSAVSFASPTPTWTPSITPQPTRTPRATP